MKIEKKVIGHLTKCYCVAPLHMNGQDYFMVAAEKQDPCYLFDLDGNKVDTVWEGPGGVMSMVQVPGSNGQFLATHKFYSPNDSKEARIVVATPQAEGWKINTLAELPFVHRFDILEKDDKKYLIACTIKSDHEYKNDWTHPGKIYVAALPDDLTIFSEEHQLQFACLKDGLTKNHGYTRFDGDGKISSIVSSENGIFRIYPPEGGNDWVVETLTTDSASDAGLADLNGDGEYELAVLAPFHGPEIKIYQKRADGYEVAYRYDKPAEFTHAIYVGECDGRQMFIAGHREGARDLLAFYWENGAYTYDIIDHDAGPANVLRVKSADRELLVAANRETDEIAMYNIR